MEEHNYHSNDYDVETNSGHEDYQYQQDIFAENQSNFTDIEYSQHYNQEEPISLIDEQQNMFTQSAVAPIPISRPYERTLGYIPATNSYYSISSADSAAEMAKYFPDSQISNMSPLRQYQEGERSLTQLMDTSTTSFITEGDPYVTEVPPSMIQQPSSDFVQIPDIILKQQATYLYSPAVSNYSLRTGLFADKAIVNDIIVDFQLKIINDAEQGYCDPPPSIDCLEPLPPIYIRPPDPVIIHQSDLDRFLAKPKSPSLDLIQFKVPNIPSSPLPPVSPYLPSNFPQREYPVDTAIVNDIVADFQSKVIKNQVAQDRHDDKLSMDRYFEPFSPIHVQSADPTVILRSDLIRLRADLNARIFAAARQNSGINPFQRPLSLIPLQ